MPFFRETAPLFTNLSTETITLNRHHGKVANTALKVIRKAGGGVVYTRHEGIDIRSVHRDAMASRRRVRSIADGEASTLSVPATQPW
jgi:hypothetical protein